MKTATLNLSETTFSGYTTRELETNWRDYPAVKLWLKVRRFDLSLPISTNANHEENTVSFTQANTAAPRNVILVHPNPDILAQLTQHLKQAGHTVTAFKRAKEANIELDFIKTNNYHIDSIVVPTNLKVGTGCTYKSFLNHKFPNLQVLTVDKSNYRETLEMKGL